MKLQTVIVCATALVGVAGSAATTQARQCELQWLRGPELTGMSGPVHAVANFDPDGPAPQPAQLIVGGGFIAAGGVSVNHIARWDGVSWQPLGSGMNASVLALTTFDPDDNGPQLPRLIAGGFFDDAGGVSAHRVAQWDGDSWQPLGTGLDGGIDPFVSALTTFDPDGDGPQPPQLIAGGFFDTAGGVSTLFIACWDGNSWQPVGSGTNYAVLALTTFDQDGPGGQQPQLFAGGAFTEAGGYPANYIARWDGASWLPLGAGMQDWVWSLTSIDPDGAGAQPLQLFAGGAFTEAGGVPANRIACWDGVSWMPLGSGMNDTVSGLTSFDPDGAGAQPSQLFAGGAFTEAGGVPANRIACWDGMSWMPLGSGMNGTVSGLTTFDPDGAGPQTSQLFAGGGFTEAGGHPANYIARWDGASWLPLGTGIQDTVWSLTSIDPDGAGPVISQLIAAGQFTTAGDTPANRIALWNGVSWLPLGQGMNDVVFALSTFDPDGPESQPPQLIAGGGFTTAGGVAASHIARWDGISWQPLGSGTDDAVYALVSFDSDGAGPLQAQLVAGGVFTEAGGVPLSRIARWDGVSWQPLGSGISGTVTSLTTFDPDGPGAQPPLLVAGGAFTAAGGVSASNIARWDGNEWQPIGSGMNDWVLALTTYDPDGSGDMPQQLIAGGYFTAAGGNSANRIARWDGLNWQALGEGTGGFRVNALSTYDPDGSDPQPPQLIAGGSFISAGGTPANKIARWDGIIWQALGTGMNGDVLALTTFDPDGDSGSAAPQLCVGGGFTTAGGEVSAFFAHWGNTTALWSSSTSGQFTDPSGWFCARAPSFVDEIEFDAVQAGYVPPPSIAVTMPDGSGPIQARSLTSRTDQVSINLRNRPFELTSGSTTIADPALIIGELPDYAASLTIRNFIAEDVPTALEVGSAVIADGVTNGQKINQLRVQDPNAQVNIEGDLYAGRRGNTGQFIVQGQADASVGGAISVGTDPGARGMVAVYNSGSTLMHSEEGRSMAVGQGGIGEWLVGGAGSLAGAQVSSIGRMDTITFGTLPTGNGYANINGSNSRWELRCQNFFIGYTGTGSARIEAGGLLDTDTFGELVISKWPGSFGTVTVTGAGSKWIERSTAITIGSNGILRVLSGGIVEALAVNVLPGGQLLGDGQIGTPGMEFLSDVFNLGDVNPGGDPDAFDEIGLLTIEGNYFQFAPPPGGGPSDSGRLQIDLAGPSPSERDHLTVTGLVQLGGMLKLNLVNGYNPQAGSPPVELLSAALVVGRFDVIEAPGFVPDVNGMVRTMRLDYGTVSTEGVGSISLEIINIQDLFDLEGAPEEGVPGLPAGSVVGDFDGFIDPDGSTTLDLAISIPDSADPANAPGTVLILRNAGTISGVWQGFALPQTIITVGADPRGLAAADFTGDGDLDIVVANFGSDTVSILSDLELPLPSVSTLAVGAEPKAVAAGPIDAGNSPDIVVANSGADTVTVHLNNGSGVFTLAETLPAGDDPSGIALAPMEGAATADGDLDIVLTNRGDDTVMVFINDVQIGSAFPTPPIVIPVGPAPDPILPGDLDNDKDLDIVELDTADAMLSIILNNGDGTFAPSVQLGSPAVGLNPASLTLINLDEDPNDPNADLDIAFICDNEDSTERVIRILRNDRDPQTGQLVFAPYLDQAEGTDPVLISAGDLDNNGENDLVTITENSALMQQQTQGLRRRDAWEIATAHQPAEYEELLGPKPTIASALLSSPVKPPPACPGDANGDSVIDSTDLNIILTDFGCAIPPRVSCPGDLDADDDTDSTDLNIVLTAFGTSCDWSGPCVRLRLPPSQLLPPAPCAKLRRESSAHGES